MFDSADLIGTFTRTLSSFPCVSILFFKYYLALFRFEMIG